MIDKHFSFVNFEGQTVTENWFYMFNVQIPSTLDRIVRETDPVLLAKYKTEMENNFYNVVVAFHDRFQVTE